MLEAPADIERGEAFLTGAVRTIASRPFKSQINATCLIRKTLMVAEMSFRNLNSPHVVEKVAVGKNRITEGKSGSPANFF